MAGMGLELELARIRRYANAITGRRFGRVILITVSRKTENAYP